MTTFLLIVAIVVAATKWHLGALGLLLICVVLLIKWLSTDPVPAPVQHRRHRAGFRPGPKRRRQQEAANVHLAQFCAPLKKPLIDDDFEPVFKIGDHLKGSPNFWGHNTAADPTWNPLDQY